MLNLLVKYAIPMGFGGWEIYLNKDIKKKHVGDDWAIIYTNMYLKKLDIHLSPVVFKMSDAEQRNVLIHELVHGRIDLSESRSKRIVEQEEELLANDLVNAIEEAMR